jgi:hypothetical protein
MVCHPSRWKQNGKGCNGLAERDHTGQGKAGQG